MWGAQGFQGLLWKPRSNLMLVWALKWELHPLKLLRMLGKVPALLEIRKMRRWRGYLFMRLLEYSTSSGNTEFSGTRSCLAGWQLRDSSLCVTGGLWGWAAPLDWAQSIPKHLNIHELIVVLTQIHWGSFPCCQRREISPQLIESF